MSTTKILFGFASAVAIVLGAPALASAQSCASNADCAKGTTCQVSGVSGGTPAPSAPPCATGSKCDVAPPTPTPTPAPVLMTCQPAPCQTSADCGADMVCHSETSETCTGSGGATGRCAPDAVCPVVPPPPPPVCTQTTISACVYKWQLPCNTDSDCGTSFVCMPSVIGSCAGSGSSGGGVAVAAGGGTSSSSGTGTGTGGAASSGKADPTEVPPSMSDGGAAAMEMCTTTSSFPGYCQPKATTCNVDSDCPSAWTCISVTTAGGIDVGGPVTGGSTPSSNAAGPAVDGGTSGGAPKSIPTTVTKLCQSPLSFPVRGDSKNSGSTDPVTAGSGSGPGSPTAGGGPSGTPGNELSTGSKPPATPSSAGATGAASDTTSSGNAGCAMAGSVPGARESALGIALLGILFGSLIGGRRKKATVRIRR